MILNLLSNHFNIYPIGFLFLKKSINCKYDERLAINMTSFSHALGCSLINTTYLLYPASSLLVLSRNFSIGYFMYDSWNVIKKLKYSNMDYVFIYHHLASIYFVNLSLPNYYVQKILLASEISNLPYYFVYHYLHTSPKNMRTITFWKKLQFYVYSIIRIPVITYLFYNCYLETQDITSSIICFPVYLMGLVWTFLLLKSY